MVWQQYRDIPGPQGARADAVTVFRQCPHDLPRAGAQRHRFQRVIGAFFRQLVDHQRSGNLVTAGGIAQRLAIAPRAGFHGLVHDGRHRPFRAQPRTGRGIKGVDRFHVGAAGAVVGVEREPVLLRHGGAGALVGLHVAAAEAVDRLLGVADHHQPTARLAVGVAIDRVKDAELHRIGILELVHQRHGPGGMQGIGQRALAIARLQCIAHRIQELVEGGLVGRFQPRLHGGLAPAMGGGEEVAQRAIAGHIQGEQRDCVRDGSGLFDQLQHPGVGLTRPIDAHHARRIAQCFQMCADCVDQLGIVWPKCGLQSDPGLPQLAPRVQQGGLCQDRGQRALPCRKITHNPADCSADLSCEISRHHHIRLKQHGDVFLQHVAGDLRATRELDQIIALVTLRNHAPQVVGQRLFKRLAVDHLATAKQRAGGKGMIGQDARAQRVQGGNGRGVEFGQCGMEALHVHRTLREISLPAGVKPGAVGGVAGVAGFIASKLAPTRCFKSPRFGQCPQQARAQAFGEFGGGGVGEGADDDAPRRQATLQQEAQVEHADGPGLAGAGAGLDQAAPVFGQIDLGPVVGSAHALPSCASVCGTSDAGSLPIRISSSTCRESASSAFKARSSGSASGSPNSKSPSSSQA